MGPVSAPDRREASNMKSRTTGIARHLLVGSLVLALVCLGSPAFAAGSIHGVVVRGDSAAPAAGARIHLADPATGEIRTSAPTAEDGSFALEDVPEAEYQIGIEADGGLYVVPTPLQVRGEGTAPLHLALSPGATKDEESPVEIVETHRKSVSVWNNPLTATLAVLGIAIAAGVVVDQAFEDDDSTTGSASPFTLEN
jgi:hypothetical protein